MEIQPQHSLWLAIGNAQGWTVKEITKDFIHFEAERSVPQNVLDDFYRQVLAGVGFKNANEYRR